VRNFFVKPAMDWLSGEKFFLTKKISAAVCIKKEK
jgi:hypothetical protein